MRLQFVNLVPVSLIVVACSSSPQEGDTVQPAPDAPTRLVAGMARRHTPGIQPDVTPKCSKTPKVAYFDGPIVQSPVVVPVFWSSDVEPQLVANMPQFYADVTQSTYWSWLWEYNTLNLTGGTGQVLLPGTATAGVTLHPSKCVAGSGKCTLTDTQLQSELTAQIEAGHLPAPVLDCTGNVETIYMVHMPPLVTVTGPDGAGTSCVDFLRVPQHGDLRQHQRAAHLRRGDGRVHELLRHGVCGERDRSRELDGHRLARAGRGGDGSGHRARRAGPVRQSSRMGRQQQQLRRDCRHLRHRGAGDTITVSGRTWVVQELLEQRAEQVHEHGPGQDLSCRRRLRHRRLRLHHARVRNMPHGGDVHG